MDQDTLLTRWRFGGHLNRFSALSLLMYDFALTFEDERELFWKKPLTFASFLFLWNRYTSIVLMMFGSSVAATTDPTDQLFVFSSILPFLAKQDGNGWSWLRFEAWVGITCAWSVELILQLRIYALYDRSRKVALIMASAFILQMALVITILAFGTIRISAVVQKLGNIGRCVGLSIPPWLYLFWVIILCFESLLCTLAMYKGYTRVRSAGRLVLTSRSLLDILLRDSVIYYVGVFLVYTSNLVLWTRFREDALDVLTPFAIALPSVMGTRLMINVRNAHYKPLRHSLVSPSDLSIHIPETPTLHESFELDHTADAGSKARASTMCSSPTPSASPKPPLFSSRPERTT